MGRAARAKAASGARGSGTKTGTGTGTGTAAANASGPGRSRPTSARLTAAELRGAQRRTQVRRRLLAAGGGVAAVVVFVAVLAGVRLSRSDTPAPTPAAGAGAAKGQAPTVIASVARELASVPAATFNSVGAGTATGLTSVNGEPTLTAGGKPEILYIGGEFCPFCAAERWALAAALSRFGTLSGLHFIHSSPTDGDIPALSFYKSGYSSRYLAFDPVEWYGEADDPSTPFGHVYLQQPTAPEVALFDRYAKESLPFVDIGNRYLAGAQYYPTDIAGLSWAQIAADMQDRSSPVARDIDGAADSLTAAICKVTNGQPGGVCTSAGVKAAAGSL